MNRRRSDVGVPRSAAVAILLLLAAGVAAVPGGLSDPPAAPLRRKLPRRVAAQQQPAGAAGLPTNATAAQQQQPAAINTTAAAVQQQQAVEGTTAQAQQAVPGTEAWRRPSVDCDKMQNCRRCRRYQGCTSCNAGYTLSERDDGLGECVSSTEAPSSPPPTTSPPGQPASSPPPTEQPASSPPPAAGGGGGNSGTPQQPGGSPRQCGMQLRNVDLWGADLADMAARTYADCCAACTIWPGCGAFTFAASQSRCYLKGSSGWELKRADGMASALMEGGSSSGSSGGNGGTVTPPVTVPSPSPSPSPLPSPSPSPPSPPPPSPRPSPSPSPRPSPSPAPQGPPVKQPPGAGTSVPRINLGRMADGSEPKVLQVLGATKTTYHYYHPEYRVSTTYCADAFAGKSQEWLMAYPWVAYCAPFMGGMSQANCGKCMRMTSTSTGSQVIVRIVDMCGHGMVDSDYLSAFVPIDTDKGGYAAGHLNVKLELVAC